MDPSQQPQSPQQPPQAGYPQQPYTQPGGYQQPQYGQQAPQYGQQKPGPGQHALSPQELIKQNKRPPQSGWRRSLHQLSGGLVNLGESPADVRRRELIARINQPLRGCYEAGPTGFAL